MSKAQVYASDITKGNVKAVKQDANTCNISIGTECKIKFIFIGLDGFLNDDNLSGVNFDLSISEIGGQKCWEGDYPTELYELPIENWSEFKSSGTALSKGYQIDFGDKHKFRKSNYLFEFGGFSNDILDIAEVVIRKNSKQIVTDYLNTKDWKSLINHESLDYKNSSFKLKEKFFKDLYFHKKEGNIFREDKYIYIIIKFYLKIDLEFSIDGASEKLIAQGSTKESLVLPSNVNSGRKKGEDELVYYEDNKKTYSLSLRRGTEVFNKCLNSEMSSLDFKIVNYRKNIYTGNGDNTLAGTAINYTGIEKNKYFQTEYIRNRVYIIVEAYGKNYLFKNNVFKNLENSNFRISDSRFYKNKYEIEKNKKGKVIKKDDRVKLVEETQYIFIHFLFDGTTLTKKEILIEQIPN